MEIKYTLENIEEVAAQLWQIYSTKKQWAFFAPMGAGKTTLIKILCEKILQSKDVISSPTFAIVNEYESPIAGKIFHMDWYRLKDEEEAIQSGIEDTLQSGHLCFIEWPEQAPMLLSEDAVILEIDILSENERIIYNKM